MGLDLYQRYAEARDIFHDADRCLGFSLSRLCFDGPTDDLNHDVNAQLAVYTLSCILTRVLKNEGVVPDVATGYSSGFYAAAYAADCFDFEDGLFLVKEAGETLLHRHPAIDGSMAVIFGLSVQEVKDICLQSGDVDIAITNTRRQIIISGLRPAVEKAMQMAIAQDALDAYPLHTATAYHSRFVRQCGASLLDKIRNMRLRDPGIPLISYASLQPILGRENLITVIAAQLSQPVLWVDLIRTLDNSAALFVEVGYGEIITRTMRWIDRKIEILNTATRVNLEKTVAKCGNLQ